LDESVKADMPLIERKYWRTEIQFRGYCNNPHQKMMKILGTEKGNVNGEK
jgi:hypothetical protein